MQHNNTKERSMTSSSRSSDRGSDQIYESVALVRRVSKTLSGGTKLSMSVLSIVGDCNGRFGYGMSKDRDVSGAKIKAVHQAKKRIIKVGLKEGRTVHHKLVGSCGSSFVEILPAPSGAGIIAGGVLRTVFELLGVKDVVVRCLGSRNPHCVVSAAYGALRRSESSKSILWRRGLKREDFLMRRSALSRKKIKC